MLKTTVTHSTRISQFSRLVQCSQPLRRHFHVRPLFPRSASWSKSLKPHIVTRTFLTSQPQCLSKKSSNNRPALRENIYTLPNFLTLSRICACPILGWSILDGNYHLATGLLVYAGLTDLADGYLARRYQMTSVLGTILDPAADKILMTTLVVSLTMQDLIPMPLAVVILGRDVLLSLSALYIRYATLPFPKTLSRYWDFSLPSAEVRPTFISKINTALQLLLMGTTTVSPILPFDLELPLQGLQYVVAASTVWSGLSYVFSKDAVRVVSQARRPKRP